jgi:hypothetical protein
MRVVRAGESHQAHGLLGGSDGFGIARGILAFLDWRKGRRSRK